MFRNYLKITFRSLWKNKVYVLINVIGMGAALAVCIVAYLNFKYNADFDAGHENEAEIYRVNFVRITNGYPVNNGSSPLPIGEAIRANVSEVDAVARFHPGGGNFRFGDELFRAGITAVDPEFFDMFTFNFTAGSRDGLKDKRTILISTHLVENHFPDTNPIGEVMTYISGEEKVDFVIGGVFERMPQNSSFRFSDSYVNYENFKDLFEEDVDDWSLFTTTMLSISNPATIPAIEKRLNDDYVEIQNSVKEDYKVNRYYLDPFVGMAQRAEREDMWNHWFNEALPVPAVFAPLIMAVFILLIACFNFMNTSIAMANRRLKEIGIRKVMGSMRRQLIFQFLGESILLVFFSLIVGILLSEILVPVYSEMWPFLDLDLNFIENSSFLMFAFILLLVTGILAGSYPAVYLSGFRPISILSGKFRFGRTGFFMKFLLGAQYMISLIAIISGVIFTQNARYQEEYDLGFDRDGIIFAPVFDEDEYNAFRAELTNNSKITGIAGTRHHASWSWYTDPIKFESSELDVDILDIGDEYLEIMGGKVVDGRNFIKDSQNDVENSVIINEELVRLFGWDDPIGKRIVVKDTIQLFVVGVVQDMYLRALWDPVKPMLLRYSKSDNYRMIVVNADVSNLTDVYKDMEAKWKVLFPNRLPNVNYMKDRMSESTLVNSNIRIIFVFLAVIAMLLSAAGLFSLVTLNIIKRMKEIGVRKVLGATISNIAFVVNRQFLVIIGIGAVIGSAVGFWLAGWLMQTIWTYYISPTATAVVVSVSILFVISLVTVGYKVYSAANANPVNTLRYE